MFSFTPLPKWSDLTTGACRATRFKTASVQPWAENFAQTAWFSSGTHILDYIVSSWMIEHNNRAPVIWMPDYFCNSATQLLRQNGGELGFYPINHCLNPNWQVCESMLKSLPPPDIFILVHYFGSEADTSLASQFCIKAKAILIEDGAHVLFPHGTIGKYCDSAFFCPHKVLSAPDGALLIGKFANLASMNKREDSFCSPWLIKRVAQKLLPELVLKKRVQNLPGFWTDLHPKGQENSSPTSLGQAMINIYTNSLNEIGASRKESAANWREAFRPYAHTCSAFFTIEQEGPAPYRFVLKFPNSEITSRGYDTFRREGVAVEKWPDLAPEVQDKPSIHAVACELRKTLLFFPVFNSLHPSINYLVDRCMRNKFK